MDELINPVFLYLGCVALAVGAALAMPRRRVSLALIGVIVAAIGGGIVVLGLGVRAAELGGLPNIYFYVFGGLAVLSALRMITHPRPVYSALYFILTILASCGLYLILSAEFMAFALVIIYAGAILITYLFVIMLATQAPTKGDEETQAEYDRVAERPWLGALVSFLLVGALTTMVLRGIAQTPPASGPRASELATLTLLPRKVDRDLAREGVLADGERVQRDDDGAAVINADTGAMTIETADGGTRVIERAAWSDHLTAGNVEQLGINLLNDHPMTIEIAGVILLMAMLGATVLARKQVELEEAAKAVEARRLHAAADQARYAAHANGTAVGGGA